MYSRLTTATMYGSLMDSLQASQRNLQELQKRISTGNKYSRLSDNPSAIAHSLAVQSALNANDKYQQNSTNAVTMLRYADSAMNNVLDAAQAIRNLVIQAGDGALDNTQLQDITAQIEANKKIMLDNLNTRVAGQYIFGGTDTGTRPFVENSDGSISYQGTDERIKYAISDGVLGDVIFAGSDIMPENEDSYFICSHYVPLDWEWTGREEKVQITVGNRTLAVFIPEDWEDNDYNKTNTDSINYSDNNGYRDPNEVKGISLEDLVSIVNSSLEEQGADMLVHAYIEKDIENKRQQLILKSNTGEKVGITGWPDTDYMPMPATATSVDLSSVDWTTGTGTAQGLMGSNNILSWKGSDDSGSLIITSQGKTETFNLKNYSSSTDLVSAINSKFASDNSTPFASLSTGSLTGRIVSQSSNGGLKIEGTNNALTEILGVSPAENKGTLSGNVDISSWAGSSGTLSITSQGKTSDFDLTAITSTTDLLAAINAEFTGTSDGDFASLDNNRLLLRTDTGGITVQGTGTALSDIFGASDSASLYGTETPIEGTSSSFEIKTNNDDSSNVKIFINKNDTAVTLAERINNIEGIYSRTTADGTHLIITAQRVGDIPEDKLHINEAEEALHYPSLTITGHDAAAKMFDFSKNADGNLPVDDNGITYGTLTERYITRKVDQSHIDIFDYLGMETAIKSREFVENDKITVAENTQLHWRVSSGGKTADIKLNAGDYSISELAERLSNAGAGWLEVTVEPGGTDEADDWGRGTDDAEPATQRIVMRGFNGEQVILLDMNQYNYADKAGLSTALRTDAYTKGYTGTGTKCVNFPSAPCVDDNIGIPMRVQMNCGMYYDVNIKRSEVVNPDTGFVDRDEVMRSIVEQVNEQEGHDIMGFVQRVDSTGKEIDGSSSIYFLSGEAFTVVDMPFNDPEWNDYSGGLAAQMGIHGGVTANLAQTRVKMKDNATFSETYNDTIANPNNLTFNEGTIRFSDLSHSVEIDVSSGDTVKDVMDRLRVQAGDWLYVNYYDTHMGQVDGRNAGDYPLISISAVDGSAVNVLDISGHIAQDALGLSTGIQGWVSNNSSYDSNGNPINVLSQVWNNDPLTDPAKTLKLSVAGYETTIDLTELRDINADTVIDAKDIAEFVNSRMQDHDVRAMVNEDNQFVLWSERGYSIKAEFFDASGTTDVTYKILGDDGSGNLTSNTSNTTYYRGGYDLEGAAVSRGMNSSELYYSGVHTQNATVRSGANTMRQNGFGVINDVISAVNSGNRDALTDKMLPRIDAFINNILTAMSENGALQARYNYNNERLVTENLIMTEDYDNLMKIDPADAISQLMIADYMYQANLAVIARLIQPTLLDFLR